MIPAYLLLASALGLLGLAAGLLIAWSYNRIVTLRDELRLAYDRNEVLVAEKVRAETEVEGQKTLLRAVLQRPQLASFTDAQVQDLANVLQQYWDAAKMRVN